MKLSEQEEAQLMHDSIVLRKTLKKLGKNQLIQLVLQQMNIAIEQQNINKVLLERLKESQGSEGKNETT